ncbi:MAG TPA: LysE family transporter [candidate division Zixibacteria bacterium]|nr:LysE family transporter [candidate division Zixibacteria bacterium]
MLPANLFLQGILIGFVVAVPVGPLGLLCVNRALSMGILFGLYSGLGVATADALAAGIAALGLRLISDFFVNHQLLLRVIGGAFLCYLGVKIFCTHPQLVPAGRPVKGLSRAYAATFFLTFSNPVTVLSFFAIYAGWGVGSLNGHYVSAAVLTAGVFVGSALWWILLATGLLLFRDRFSHYIVGWIHKISGAVITVFGIVVFLGLWSSRVRIGR